MFAQTRRSGPIVAAILLLGLIGAAAPVRAELITGSDYVSGWQASAAYYYGDNIRVEAFAWEYAYTMDFDGTTVTADIQIEFDFDSGIVGDEQAWKNAMETAIEEKWNNKHTFEYDGVTIASAVDVTYDGPFDQTVLVKPGSGGTNMLNWYWDQTGTVSAHEFGHMLALYDEYWGGALNSQEFVDYTALMGSVSGTPAMPDRYYQPFVDFVVALQIPEPATTTMIISGVLTGLAMLLRRRKLRSLRGC